MRLALPIACALAFCIVCIGNSDAIVPFGYILAEFLWDDSTPLIIRLLFLVPLVGPPFSSLVRPPLTRSIFTIISLCALVGLWIFGLFAYVVYPMRGNQIPNSVPVATSVPFVLVVIATVTHSIKSCGGGRANNSFDRSADRREIKHSPES